MAASPAAPAAPRRASIRAHLVRLVLAVALPLAALAAWVLFTSARNDLRQAREQVFHLAQVTASRTADFLGQAHNILNGFAARPAMRALDASRCDPLLKDFVALAPRFANAVTVDARGSVACSAAPLPGGGPIVADPGEFRKIRDTGRLSVGKPLRGPITGRWLVPLAVPLRDAQGEASGAVALMVDLLTFTILPSLDGLPQGTVAGIIDGEGTVLARAREAEKFVGSNQIDQPGVRHVLREKRGAIEAVGIDGIERILGFTPVPGTDWIAVASVPRSAVYSGIHARIAATAFAGIAVLAAALWLAFRWSRQIQEPVAALAGAAEAIAAGNLAARAPVGGVSEIADVAMRLNHMLDALGQAQTALRASEQRFRLAAASGEVWDWNFTTNTISHAAEFWSKLGYDGREVTDPVAMFESVLHPDDVAPWRQAIAEHVRQRVPYDLEFRARAKSGRYLWFRTTGQAIWDEAGRATYMAGTTFEITARKQAEARLRESEERLRLATEGAQIGTWDWDTVSNEVRWDPVLLRMLGLEPGEMSVDVEAWLRRAHPEDQPRLRAALRDALKTRLPHAIEFRVIDRDGTVRWFAAEGRAHGELPGRATRMVGIARDVTAQKNAEAGRLAAAARFETLFRGAPEAMSISEEESGRLLQVNDFFCELFGYAREALVGRTSLELNLWSAAPRRDQMIARLRSGGRISGFEGQARKSSGELIDVMFSADRIEFGGAACLLLMFRDISERKRSEAALLEAGERLQRLSHRLIEVQEDERKHIARELHDELGQALTAAKIRLQSSKDGASHAQTVAILDQALSQVRALSLDLHPPQIDDLGLAAALRSSLGRWIDGTGVKMEYDAPTKLPPVQPAVALAAYRIAQEAIGNALRHAQAGKIMLRLAAADGTLVMEVVDDGRGFDLQAARLQAAHGASLGLLSMEERARLAGGTLGIRSAAGAGTTVTVRLPL
jgi:PAS domain S-box-containing protein